MHKKHNGYFTIEASFILPVVLFLYILIIFSALFLYCRCAISQDDFLLGVRAGRFTFGKEHYGEIIYGSKRENEWSAENYVRERLAYKRDFYPFYFTTDGGCILSDNNASVQTSQRGTKMRIVKNIEILNPIKIIREERKNYNA